MKALIIIRDVLSLPIPSSHINIRLTLYSFCVSVCLRNKVNTQLNIIDKKSMHNDYSMKVKNSTDKPIVYTNQVRKIKHFPPANKEWINSIYAYNNTIKNLPILDKTLTSLIRGYFNLYSNILRNKLRKHGSKRFEIRKARRLINRVYIGKPELKHGTDNIVITLYIYNIEKKYFINRIKKMPAVYKLNSKNASNTDIQEKIKVLYLKKTGNASIKIKHKLNNHKKLFLLKTYKPNDNTIINRYNKHFLRNYVTKFLRKEIVSIFHKQTLLFSKSKFEKKYITFLANHIMTIYNKKVEFNFVNLKHVYLDSQIFSDVLVTKLKKLAKLKKSFLIGITNFLHMFNVPRISSLSVHNEIFNRQYINQNVNNNILYNPNFTSHNYNNTEFDIMDNIFDITKFITKLDTNKYKTLSTIYHVTTLIKTFNTTKYKIINGIRLEIAGRFTKRSSAARSVFKIRNKGSIKNKDSSTKGLPSVLLKGYAKSNLQFNKVYSKVRGGSFGIKSSLSGG